MLDAIGEVLPAAMGVALSPFPIVAIVLVLGTPRANANGVAFLAGWLVGLAALTTIVLVATGGTDDPSSDASTVVSWLKIGAGIGLLAVAVKKWRGRPRPGEEPKVPGWMASLDEVRPARALVLGAALGGANPKNVAFTFAAASSIAALGLSGTDAASAGALYVALGSSVVLAALAGHLVARARSEAVLATVKEFMLANNVVIVMVVLLALGAKILGDGLAGL